MVIKSESLSHVEVLGPGWDDGRLLALAGAVPEATPHLILHLLLLCQNALYVLRCQVVLVSQKLQLLRQLPQNRLVLLATCSQRSGQFALLDLQLLQGRVRVGSSVETVLGVVYASAFSDGVVFVVLLAVLPVYLVVHGVVGVHLVPLLLQLTNCLAKQLVLGHLRLECAQFTSYLVFLNCQFRRQLEPIPASLPIYPLIFLQLPNFDIHLFYLILFLPQFPLHLNQLPRLSLPLLTPVTPIFRTFPQNHFYRFDFGLQLFGNGAFLEAGDDRPPEYCFADLATELGSLVPVLLVLEGRRPDGRVRHSKRIIMHSSIIHNPSIHELQINEDHKMDNLSRNYPANLLLRGSL